MGKKFNLLVGLAAGYVLGTRAGHEQYEKIRTMASKVRQTPLVARPLDRAGQYFSDVVRSGGESVTDKVADAVKERLFGVAPDPRVQQNKPAQSPNDDVIEVTVVEDEPTK